MVTRLIFSLLLLPLFLFSGEFTASVDRTQVYLGESFTFNLTLKEVSPRGAPTIAKLKKSFIINSEQQSSNTVIVNGQVTSATAWQFTLIPQSEGELIIPSISVNTSDGTFSTEPIMITALKGISSRTPESSDVEGVNLVAEVSNSTPYKNEQIAYTVRLCSKRSLANIQMHKIQVEDAIVEVNGEPKVFERVVNGIRADIVEFSYLITPLKAGPLEIPPAIVQGGIPIKRRANGGSLFDNDFDPIAIMQGFNQLKPFSITTEKTILDVQPAIAGVNPWLPARALQIEETFDHAQPLQVGSPLTRSFKIAAEGVKASQLPSLQDKQVRDSSFKIYADNPGLKDEVKDSRIKSYRTEHYTLVPQEDGDLTLPEIAVVWWDVIGKEKRVTIVPARTLQVLPAPVAEPSKASLESQDGPILMQSQVVITKKNYVLYTIIAGLASLLFVAIAFGILLQNKVLRLSGAGTLKSADKSEFTPQSLVPKSEKKPIQTDKKEKLPDLNPT